MTSRKWRSSIMNSRAFPSADVGSDHQLVLANLKLKLKYHEKERQSLRTDVGRLRDPLVRSAYKVVMERRLKHLPRADQLNGVNDIWNSIKAAFTTAAKDVLGVVKLKEQGIGLRTRQDCLPTRGER